MIDGKSLLRGLRELLEESSTSAFLDTRTTYEWLYLAAIAFVDRTECLTSTQTITTVASQRSYSLDANFMKLYLKDSNENFYIKYNNGSNESFIKWKDYEDIIYQNNTTSIAIPDNFSVIDDSTIDAQVTGTCTTAGALSGGQTTLTDSAADFSDVSPGDIVHNTTDGSDGVVLSKTSSIILVTALFDGTDNDWDSSDAYIIQPQARLQLVFDPPPSTGSHTATVYYVQKPNPVFSDYGIYRFQSQYLQAIVFYAAWLYKYKDREANFGDRFFRFWENETRRAAKSLNKTFNRKGWTLSLKK